MSDPLENYRKMHECCMDFASCAGGFVVLLADAYGWKVGILAWLVLCLNFARNWRLA